MTNPPQKYTILVTGASGFVGRNFIKAVKEQCVIYALARRSQQAAGVEPGSNIIWIRCDLANADNLRRVTDDIALQGGCDFVFHFAGYYDFSNQDSLEYQRTNVDGTRYLLECVEKLKPKRFIFSSSLTVTDFFTKDLVINENSPMDAKIPYARSKRAAEELIREYSARFPCTIVRLAAIFSDWCEYGPLYILLSNWLSGSWLATLMPGKGETALPYLHVADLSNMLRKIMEKDTSLSQFDVLAASRDGCVSQKELFGIASRYYYGRLLTLKEIPLWLAYVGILGKGLLGYLTGREPFEKVWMLKYIDQQMKVDSSATREILDWQPLGRYDIVRRMLFMIENMKRNPNLWAERNLVMAHKKEEERPGLKIYEVMVENKRLIVEEHVNHLKDPRNSKDYPVYSLLSPESLRIRANMVYEMLEVVFLNGNHHHIISYAEYLARQRFMEDVGLSELHQVLQRLAKTMQDKLLSYPQLSAHQQRIHDEIGLSMQLFEDEIEEEYEELQTS